MVGYSEGKRKRLFSIGQVLLDETSVERLGNRIDGDEAEALCLARLHYPSRVVPPVHYQVDRLGYPAPVCFAQRFCVVVTQSAAHGLITQKGRVADQEIGRRPLGWVRVV